MTDSNRASTMSDTPMKTNIVRVSKKLCWSVSLVVIAAIIVLASLTIYFGVRSSSQPVMYTEGTVSFKTTTGQQETTTSLPPLQPMEQVPIHLKPELYQWTVTPDLTKEILTGPEILPSLKWSSSERRRWFLSQFIRAII